MCLHIHSATAARVKYPVVLLRYKPDALSACCGVFDLSATLVLLGVRIFFVLENTRQNISNQPIASLETVRIREYNYRKNVINKEGSTILQ